MDMKFLPGPRLLLVAGALVAVGSASLVLAQVSAAQQFGSPIQAQSAYTSQSQQGVDLVGVSLSDLVRIYLERLDDRSYVACAELVQDARKVSLRASHQDARTAIVGVLQVHGYGFTERGGVTYVCPAQQAARTAGGAAGGVPLGSPLDGAPGAVDGAPVPSIGGQSLEAASAASVTSYREFAEGGSSVADRLAERGFVPQGCIDGGNGVIKVAMKSEGERRTHFLPLSEIKRSKLAPLVICRL